MDQFFVLNKDALKRPTEWKIGWNVADLESKHIFLTKWLLPISFKIVIILIVLKRKTRLNFSMDI